MTVDAFEPCNCPCANCPYCPCHNDTSAAQWPPPPDGQHPEGGVMASEPSPYADPACLAYLRREFAEAERRAAIIRAVQSLPVVRQVPVALHRVI